MYPKNAGTPPRIAIGAVIQISDGAVQSSGVSVVVRAEGGSETAGGGTITYGASSNVVYYAPTQAETNYTAFVVTAYKTGCIPVSQTIITTASATSGTTNVAAINSVATSSVTAVNANVGTTQPVNYTGTGSSALVKTDMIDVNSVAYGSSTLNTLASHDPGATLGTSTLTQTQVSGGAYALNSAIFAFNAALDFTTTQKAATLARVTLVDTTTTATTATNLTNAATAGDFTATMKTSIGTAVAASAVASVTGNVGGNVTGSVGSVVGAVGSVTGNVGGNVTGSVGSVTATVTTDMTQTTQAEPGQGAPAATATPAAKLAYLYKAWRNKKTQTATVYSLFADDTTTVDQKSAVSDDGTTTTVGEVATGP